VDLLGGFGTAILITNYERYFELAAYLFRYTKKMSGVFSGVPSLREVFQRDGDLPAAFTSPTALVNQAGPSACGHSAVRFSARPVKPL